MHVILFFLWLSAWSTFAFGQENKNQTTNNNRWRSNHHFDVTMGIGPGLAASSLSWHHLHGFGKKKQRFNIGYGIRFTAAIANDVEAITAPAKLTTGSTGPGVIFQETRESYLDTLKLKNPFIGLLNLSLHLQYNLTPKLSAGFNIDAIGFSFGNSQTGVLTHENQTYTQTSKPTSFNALLISDNDIGSLQSEFYGRYWFNNKWAGRAGVQFLFLEHTTNTRLFDDNDRFRVKGLLFFIGGSYGINRK